MRDFRAALVAVPPHERDAWVDRELGLGPPLDDGPELPRGCVGYLPCPVDALIEVVDRAAIGPDDVFVDVGAGVGRAAAVVERLTGATVIGVEIQTELVRAAVIAIAHGDAAAGVPAGSVYFLYCPFSGERLARLLAQLEAIARTRPIRVCCVDLPLPACAWLTAEPGEGRVTVYRSVAADDPVD